MFIGRHLVRLYAYREDQVADAVAGSEQTSHFVCESQTGSAPWAGSKTTISRSVAFNIVLNKEIY